MKNLLYWIVTYGCRLGLEIMCSIRKEGWEKLPARGPLIAFVNHTGTLEAPLLYTLMAPRPTTGMGKIESWDVPFLRFIFTVWDIIPVRRGEADMDAMKRSIEALKSGKILGISPEGTRSKTGGLIRAQGGLVMLALHAKSPLQPIGQWGGEHFGSNVKRFKRTQVEIKVGERFWLDAGGEKVTKEIRQQMADEMMYQLAALLPEELRGAYSDLENATTKYLRFEVN